MSLGVAGIRSYSGDMEGGGARARRDRATYHLQEHHDMANRAKLHEILAVEKARTGQVKTLLDDTSRKFNRATDYFSGHLKSLKLIRDDPANAAIEADAREQRQLPTTVVETLDYLFRHW